MQFSFIIYVATQVHIFISFCRIYQNDGTGSSKDFKGGPIDSKINDGDIVKVKVAPHDNETPLQFDEDGDLKSHQKLRILFYKNNELVSLLQHI